MDGPSPLGAEGIPGPKRAELPLNLQVVNFGP
jgi:hypothetical protein